MNALADEQLDRIFAALADPTRRAIIGQLGNGSENVGNLPNPHQLSPGAITKHLKVLESADLITQGRSGQFRPCQLNPEPLKQAMKWIADRRAIWEGNFDLLGEFLESKDLE